MRRLAKLLMKIVALGGACAWSGGAHAQYTAGNEPIRLIVPYGVGGGSDFAARLLAKELSPLLNRPIVVDNRPGADGLIGTALVAKAKPDGQTWVLAGGGAITAATFLHKSVPYDAMKDLQPVYMAISSPLALYVSGAAPYGSLPEFVKAEKASGKGAYGASSMPTRVAMELFKESHGLALNYISYKSSVNMLVDVASSTLSAGFVDIAAGSALTQTQRVKPLAVMRKNRSPLLPDVPSLYDFGYSGPEVFNWAGIFVPTGTPKGIIDQIAGAMKQITSMPEVQERFVKGALELNADGDPANFAEFLKEEYAFLSKVIPKIGIEPQ